jgi:ABC-2 type transport system permease protein
MRQALVIAWRDVRSAFDGPLAYGVIAAWLVTSFALFFVMLLSFSDASEMARLHAAQDRNILERFSVDAAVVSPLLRYLALLLIGLTPLLTMRLFAEEARQGTLELLLTAPVSPVVLVLGKFLGGVLLCAIPLALTAWFPIVLSVVATPDALTMFTGYAGLFLIAACFVAVGLFFSALTDAPLLSAFLALCALLLLILCGVVGSALEVNGAAALEWVSPTMHYESLASGVLDTADLAYFACFLAAWLFLTLRVVESRRWR